MRAARKRSNSVLSVKTGESSVRTDVLDTSMTIAGFRFVEAIQQAGKVSQVPAGHSMFGIFPTTMSLIQVGWLHQEELKAHMAELESRKNAFILNPKPKVQTDYLQSAENFRSLVVRLEVAMIELKSSFKSERATRADHIAKINKAREDQKAATVQMSPLSEGEASGKGKAKATGKGKLTKFNRKIFVPDGGESSGDRPLKRAKRAPTDPETEIERQINEMYCHLN